MSGEKDVPDRPEDAQEPWTFEAARARQLRMGLQMTPAERLRWLEETVEELRPWVGRARQGRPMNPLD